MKPFQYFEVRPCVQLADESADTTSFTSEDEFDAACERLHEEGADFITFWTIYGIEDDGRAIAIADDIAGKESAHDTLQNILGAFIAIRDFLRSDEPIDLVDRIDRAADMIDDFVGACSTLDRI